MTTMAATTITTITTNGATVFTTSSTIYIPKPNHDGGASKSCPNDIDELCALLDQTIKTTLQNTLNTLKKDAVDIADR